jgi:hypothetical protein
MSYHKELETNRSAKESRDIQQKRQARDRLDRVAELVKRKKAQKREAGR